MNPTIPLLNLKRLHELYGDQFLEAIKPVLQNAHFIGGPAVEAFEVAFSQWLGSGVSTVGTGNGTDSIHLAVRAFQFPPGTRAIVPAMTYTATVEGLLQAGLKVDLVDITPDTWLMDTTKLESVCTPETKLIVPVHLYGQMAAMDLVAEFAEKKNLKILEDASQAHGASFKAKGVGFYSDVATFSFYPGKNLGAFGDAGAIVSRDKSFLEKCRRLGNHGGIAKYEHLEVGYNSRLDALQAAVLGAKLAYIDAWNARRRQIAEKYRRAFADLKGIVLQQIHLEAVSVFHLFVVLVEDQKDFRSFLSGQGIETGLHYPQAIHQLPAYQECYRGLNFPNAEKLAAGGVSLPLCPTLQEWEMDKIIQSVRDYF